ncbi:hypothetical protein Tco_0025743 [Tanacetum coccineum]
MTLRFALHSVLLPKTPGRICFIDAFASRTLRFASSLAFAACVLLHHGVLAACSNDRHLLLFEYTGLEVQHFRDTLLQHLGNVKKSVAERTRHQRQYERRVNKRQMQTQESKIDTGKALDADLVDTESIRTYSIVQDDSSRSGNDTDVDDSILTHYEESQLLEVPLSAECNICAIKTTSIRSN